MVFLPVTSCDGRIPQRLNRRNGSISLSNLSCWQTLYLSVLQGPMSVATCSIWTDAVRNRTALAMRIEDPRGPVLLGCCSVHAPCDRGCSRSLSVPVLGPPSRFLHNKSNHEEVTFCTRGCYIKGNKAISTGTPDWGAESITSESFGFA